MEAKKILMPILVAILSFTLVACDSGNYKQAEELYIAGDYTAALELYNALGEYEDSQTKAKMCQYAIANDHYDNSRYEDALPIYRALGTYEKAAELASICEREIGMAQNADYDFLAALEQSVIDRMGKATGTDYAILVNTEFAYLEKYVDETFYDANIQELAELYFKGLYEQRDALKAEIQSDYQVGWQTGLVHRYEALKRLYEDHDFLADNMDFVANYVMTYDSQKALLDAYTEIEADISAQTSGEELPVKFESNGGNYGTLTYTLVNNTNYTFSSLFEFTFLSEDNTIFYNTNDLVENIKPNNSYVVSLYVDFTNCNSNTFNWEWNNYYTEVQLP